MHSSEPLFLLIKSLSASEKRYFRLFAKTHAGVVNDKSDEKKLVFPNYYLLYEIINKCKKYEEDRVKAKFFKTARIKPTKTKKKFNFSHIKSESYKKILAAMRMYHAENSIPVIIRNILSEVNFLVNKQLPVQAQKRLHEAKKLALQNDLLPELSQIMVMERMLIFQAKEKTIGKQLTINYEESVNVLAKFEKEYLVSILSDKVFAAQKGKTKMTPELDFLENQLEQLKGNTPLTDFSKRFQINFLTVKSICSRLKGKHKESLQNTKDQIAIFDANPNLIYIKERRYLGLLDNYVNRLFLNGAFEEILTVVDSMQKFKLKDKDADARLFHFRTNGLLLYELGKNDYQKLAKMGDEVADGIERFQSRITKSKKLSYIYCVAIGFFGIRDFDNCRIWLTKINNQLRNATNSGYKYKSLLMELLVFFEEGIFSIIKQKALNLRRSVNQFGDLSEVEKQVLDILIQTMKPKNTQQMKEFIKQQATKIQIPSSEIPGTDAHLIWLSWYQ